MYAFIEAHSMSENVNALFFISSNRNFAMPKELAAWLEVNEKS